MHFQVIFINGVLHFIDHRHGNQRRVAVPTHLRERLLRETHGGIYMVDTLYNALLKHWWWKGMYTDILLLCKRCPDCAVVTGGGRQHKPPLQPIPVERPFQKIGVDVMDLPCSY